MRTPPSHLPVVPDGWVYIGAENEINVTGCEDDKLAGFITGDKWPLHILAPIANWSERWGTSGASPHWHYIAPRDSKIARLNLGEDWYPTVPEGFEYWRKGSSRDFTHPSDNVFIFSSGFNSWNPLPIGNGPHHYALRIGSDTHRASIKEDPKSELKSILAEWREARFGPKLTFTAGVDSGSCADQPTVSVFAYEELQAERDRWAEATSEQLTQVKRLTAENESLKAQVKHRDSIIQGIKVALNNVMDF